MGFVLFIFLVIAFFLKECELFSPPWLSLLVFFTLFLKHSKSLSIWFNIVHLTAATKALKELPLCPEHIKSCRMIRRNNIFVYFRLFFIFCHWAISTKSLFSWKYEKSLIINILFQNFMKIEKTVEAFWEGRGNEHKPATQKATVK